MRDEVLDVRFSDCMVPEVYQRFWGAMARGEFITDAAAEAGTYRKLGAWWLAACGGVRPRRGRDLKGRCLSFAEREEIAVRHAERESVRRIATVLGRSPSTISRELNRNRDRSGRYRATAAHAAAYDRASRPSWPPTPCCVPGWRQTWPRGTHQSRSPVGSGPTSPTRQACGCVRRRFISRCTCSRAARSNAS